MDRLPKKPKLVTRSVVGETAVISKLPPKPGPKKVKSLMMDQVPVNEEHHVLLREDSRYALKQLSSILKDDDYANLGNHATKAIGETGLFSLAQGLMDRCVSQETVMGHLREKLGAKETELQELLAWKDVQVGKLGLTKHLLKELEAQVKALKKILKDKEEEILEANQLCQAKEDAIKEYYDSNDLLRELNSSFANGFDDCFHQVKASFPNLDLSHIFINAQAQTPTHPVYFKGIDKLFADDSTHDPQGIRETAREDQGKSIEGKARPVEENCIVKEKDGENPITQQ